MLGFPALKKGRRMLSHGYADQTGSGRAFGATGSLRPEHLQVNSTRRGEVSRGKRRPQ